MMLPLLLHMYLVVVVSIAAVDSLPDSASPEVKIWSTCYSNGSCFCGSSLKKSVQCSNESDRILIQPCYCMYYDPTKNMSVAGHCMFTCFYPPYLNRDLYYSIDGYEVYNTTLFNTTKFNDLMCNAYYPLQREGRFCGRCKDKYGLAVYSYDYASCINCTAVGYKSWLKYLAIAFLPLTVFYVLVVTFRVSVTTSRLNGVLFVVQCILSPLQLRVFYIWLRLTPLKSNNTFFVLKLIFSVFGIANLDFFRELYPDFCLHPTLNVFHVMSLDYIIALYPFFMILCTYVLICLYDRNFRPIVSAWKYCKWCFKYFRKQNVNASLIETFALFLLLSSVKILVLCYDTLNYTVAYTKNGTKLDDRYMYYDASIVFFGPQHRPFAALAIFTSFTFVTLPLLLLVLYPCRFFQKCLNNFKWRCRALHIFMDAFQGCYKTKPHDFRYFSAWYLFLRFLFLLAMGYFESFTSVPVAAGIMVCSAVTVALFRPYVNNFHNKCDVLLTLAAAFFYISMSADLIASILDYRWLSTAQRMLVFSIVSLLAIAFMTVLWLPLKYIIPHLYNMIMAKFRARSTVSCDINASESYETFAERGSSDKDSSVAELANCSISTSTY